MEELYRTSVEEGMGSTELSHFLQVAILPEHWSVHQPRSLQDLAVQELLLSLHYLDMVNYAN